MEFPAKHPQPTALTLRLLLAKLFLHFIPSIFLGIVSLVLTETARFINHAANLCQLPSPPDSPTPTSQTTSPLTEPVPTHSYRNFRVPPTPPLLPTPPPPPVLSLTLPSHALSTPPAASPPPPPPSCSPPSPSPLSPLAPPPSPPPLPPPVTSPPRRPSEPPTSPPISTPMSCPRSLPPSSPPTCSLPPFAPSNTPSLPSPLRQSSSLHVSVNSVPTSPPPAPTPPPPYSPLHSQVTALSTTPELRCTPELHSTPSQKRRHLPSNSPLQHPATPNPSTLVGKRVTAYENFIADTAAQLDQPLRLPFPSEDSNDPLRQTLSVPSCTSSQVNFPIDDIVPCNVESESESQFQAESISETESGTESETEVEPEPELEPATESGPESVSEFAVEVELDSESEAESQILQPGGQSGDVQTFVAPTETEEDDSRISTPEAPGGRESLQELIPEDVPPAYPTLSLDDEENDVNQGEVSLGRMSPLRLSRNGSIASLRTESYSSPDSHSHSHLNQHKNRHSWRGSDHDFFSEEPILTFKSIEELNVDTHETGSATSSSLGNDDYMARRDHDILDPPFNGRSHRGRRRFSFEQDFEIAEAIPTHPRDSPSSHHENKSSKESRRGGKGFRNRRVLPDSKLFRQASVDLPSINTATFLTDRPREGPPEHHRFIPNRFAGLRFSRTPSVDYATTRVTGFNNVSRSQSTAETHFEDWPEYTPSGEEDGDSPGMSPRHASDLSHGVKARREDMLPVELLDDPQGENNFIEGTENLFGKLGAKVWKRRPGRHSVRKDEAKALMKGILRRKRKVSGLGNEPFTIVSSESNHHLGDRSTRVSARDRDLSFESELEQDTVFSLLERLCPECGFQIVVRRANHKIKIGVPCEGSESAMLLSISLTRVANGRNTLVTVCRSKEDASDGHQQTIEKATAQLQKRLAGQVEFIEDSFASLYFDDSAIDVSEKASRIE